MILGAGSMRTTKMGISLMKIANDGHHLGAYAVTAAT